MASHEEVAHRWAQNSKPGANLTGYAMFCAGGRIYSHGHHFIIARFVTLPKVRGNPPPRDVVLFNADGYSVSTAKHKSIVYRAIPRAFEVFEIPDLKDIDYSDKANGRAVIDWHVAQAVQLTTRAKRARTRGPWLLEEAQGHLTKAARFAEAFGHKWRVPASLDAMVAKAEAEAAKQAKANAKARKEAEERRAAEAKRQREIDAAAFLAWRRGEPGSRCPASWRVDDAGRCFVRRSPDGESLQTSLGADVPWSHAVKAFRFIRLCVERGEAWERNGRVVRVGHYQVDKIDADGNMTAGCHSFLWDDMRALAEREGVFDLTPSAEAVETREGVAH